MTEKTPALADMTPVEIDTELADFRGKIADLRSQSNRFEQEMHRIDNVEPDSYASKLPQHSPEQREKLAKEVARLEDEVATLLVDEVAPRQAEWIRRGRWTRYYLVDNTGGHVHAGQDCSTCFPTTQYAWLVEQSGMSAPELVAMAGEKACTVCFPWAPVDLLKKKTLLEAPERKAARLEREAKKAAAAAKKAAKAIANPDGTPLAVFDWRVPERQRRTRNGFETEPARDRYKTLTTLAAARGWLADQFETWRGNDGGHRDMQRVAEAIAHKEGKGAAQVIEEARGRAARRVR